MKKQQGRKRGFGFRILAVVLVIALMFGCMPLSVFAAAHDGQVRVIVENTTYSVADGAPWDGVLVDAWVDIDQSTTMMSAVEEALGTIGATQTGAENNYISEINGLSAGVAGGGMSGWMGTLNDWFTNEGFGAFTVAAGTLVAGDEVRIMHSMNYGEDLGGSWGNNDKTVKAISFSTGTLNTVFDKNTHSYTLTVPAGTTDIVVTPTASNKNFQVRTSINGMEYKRTQAIPVVNGTVISVKCGDPLWPSMNGGSYGSADSVPAETYAITVAVEGSVQNTAPVRKNGIGATAEASVVLGASYALDLSTIFEDADGDALTYTVSVDSAAAVAIDQNYIYTPPTAGQTTLVLRANDGQADSADMYTVTLTAVQEVSGLESLMIHTGSSPSNTSVLIKNTSDPYTAGQVFDAAMLTYALGEQWDSITQLRFRAKPAEAGATVTLHYGDGQSKDITWTGGSSKWANCLQAGKNTFTIVVTPPAGSSRLAATYTFTVHSTPTLSEMTASAGQTQLYFDKAFNAQTSNYTLTVPQGTQSITFAAMPKSADYGVTYNGNPSDTIDISSVNQIDISVTAGSGESALTNTYSIALNRVAQLAFGITAHPSDAIVKVYDQRGAQVAAGSDGRYIGMFGIYDYTYVVSRYGYVAQTGTVPSAGGQLAVTLEKAADDGLTDVGADWKNFRGSDNNMAITDVETPTDTTNINLKWNAKLGSGWSASPSVQVIADNALIVMSGTTLYKLDLQTGETLETGAMAAAPNFGYTPPIYAEGMVFCPLTGGRIQAFNAETLESLWIYTDPLGGQSLSPIAYADGYLYTGFWNGETKDANFVALSVTDEEVGNPSEAKIATWKHPQAGGFYWAGAVIIGDAVIVGTDDGGSGFDGVSKLYSFNRYTGKKISELDITGDQRSSIAYDVASGKIYFTTKCGYLYSADVNTATGTVSGLKGVNHGAQTTSTPVVYKGKVYFGTGSGISSTGSSGNLVVADADNLSMLYAVGLKGYPQCSMLLSTAYEESTGYIYLYSTYNAMPGGLSMIKVKPDNATEQGAQLVELYDATSFENYCITSPICGKDGTIYYKNDSGNVFAVGVPQAYTVMKLIRAIGTVGPDSGSAIAAARNAYDALPDTEKPGVTNYAVLTAAEAAYAQIQLKIKRVSALIDEIGSVTLDSESKIVAARSAYNTLSVTEQKYVSNYGVLTAAETRYKQLKNANVVSNLIDVIGIVTKDSGQAIIAARSAYDALLSEEQALVGNYAALTAAERVFAELGAQQNIAGTDGNNAQTEENTQTQPEGTTKSLGNGKTEIVIDGIKYTVSDEAAAVVKKIAIMPRGTAYDPAAVIEAYQLYAALSDSQKTEVMNYDDLQAQLNRVGVDHHKDDVTGIRIEGVDWNIKITVTQVPASDEAYQRMMKNAGSNVILAVWNIQLTDVLTGEPYQPDTEVTVKLTASGVSGYDTFWMAHDLENGKIEYIPCELQNGEIIWKAASFSRYGLLGGAKESALKIEDTAQNNTTQEGTASQTPPQSMLWVWILVIAAGIAVVVLAALAKSGKLRFGKKDE
ncbi:MAG: cadherin-like beta sandwich domain-containing protein [Christensenella sp.]|nr:cadherin-like beta sandwich domain-containing protein [Christensenella sp.]